MSIGPIAEAKVLVKPDLTGFQAALQSEVNRAVKAVTVPTIKANIATNAAAASVANAGVRSSTGGAARAAAKETGILANQSNILRGSLIGLSRVTPVTVFGLTIYGTAALAAGVAIKAAIRSTADFEHQLNVLQATTGATVLEMTQIAKEAKQLGADLSLPSTSAGDAALAMTELAKAGLSVQDTLAGARGVLQLAAAAQIDVGSAATFVATELNAFGLAGDKATHVADLLAGASIAAQGDIRDFGTAFQQVSAVSRQVGLSLESTTGALTELAKAGLRGADGGTSLRTTLLRLAPTTKQAAQYQKALGIEIDDSLAIGKQLPDLIDQYRESLSALTPVQQQQALAQIFGQDAIRAASILIRGGSEALRENTDAANQNGAANRLAQANAKGLSGSFNGLKSNLDTLSITLGSFVKGPLTALVTVAAEGVGGINALAESLDKFQAGLPGFVKTGLKIGLITSTAPVSAPVAAANAVSKRLRGEESAYEKAVREAREKTDAFNQSEQAKADAAAKRIRDEGARRAANTAHGIAKAGQIHDEGTRLGPHISEAEKAKIRARFAAQEAANKKPKPIDVTTPARLENQQFQAQLDDNLQAELKADERIESYFRKRLTLAKGKPAVYNAVLGALTQAHAATQSVLGQIKSESQANQQAQDEAVKTAISNQRTRLENAAFLTDHTGEAEKKLIAFYRKEAADIRLTTAERLAYQAAYNTEIDSQRKAVVAQAKAEIDLRNSRFDLAIQRAGLTPSTADDRKAINNKIKAIQNQIDGLKTIKKKTIEQKQEIVSLTSVILGLKGDLQNLKNGGGGGGFSLNDLFKEAVNNFVTFGSNIAGRQGVLSPQDARGAFSQNILAQLGSSQLTEAQKQTAQLREINAKLGPAGAGGKILGQKIDRLGSTPGLPYGAAAKLAATEGYVNP